MKKEVVKIFNDLEEYHNFCRFEMREFNPAHLYRKSNRNFRAFLAYKNAKRHSKGRNFNKPYDKKR